MNARQRRYEKDKIDSAIDDFSSEMLERMTQKMDEGFTGWEGMYPIDRICDSICQNATLPEGRISKKEAIDIGNYAMMLWMRANTPTAEDEPPTKEPT